MRKITRIKVLPTILALGVMMFLGGCGSTTTVAPKLISSKHLKKPIINKSIETTAPITNIPHRYQKVEESLQESLDIALVRSNIFTKESRSPYKLIARVTYFSQSAMSQNFGNKLKVNYTLYSDKGKLLINETIYTVGKTDEWFFAGQKRAERARAVNIAKNVNEFMVLLPKKLR